MKQLHLSQCPTWPISLLLVQITDFYFPYSIPGFQASPHSTLLSLPVNTFLRKGEVPFRCRGADAIIVVWATEDFQKYKFPFCGCRPFWRRMGPTTTSRLFPWGAC